jgi:serine/threonine protein kinase
MEGKRLGKYRILRELGRGGMGVVYEAEHDQVRHRVAIKVIDPLLARNPEQAARVRVEGIAANLPRHPGIVQVLETDHLDGTPYIVMELVSGQSLREILLHCGGRLETQRVMRLGKQLADAFAAAHDVGIVHRDVKPENVMLTEDAAVVAGERTKVLDFGIALVPKDALMISQQSLAHESDPGQFAGTIPYMAPEQLDAQGYGAISAKTDVYQLGVLLYELLSGETPFSYTGQQGYALMMCIVQQEPKALTALRPEVPWELTQLIHRMLAKDPVQRPSMREVLSALRQIEPSGFGPLQEVSPSRVGLELSRRSQLLLGVLCSVLASALVWWLWPDSQTVTWHLDSIPSGADVLNQSGQVLGRTPWEEVRARDIGHKELRVRLSGYRTEALLLDSGRDYRRSLRLTKLDGSSPDSPQSTAR